MNTFQPGYTGILKKNPAWTVSITVSNKITLNNKDSRQSVFITYSSRALRPFQSILVKTSS